MRPAEIILRICGSIGAWLLFITHALVIAVLPRADQGSEGLWGGTAVLAVLNALGIVLLGLGLPWREFLRWFGLIALPLAALGIWALIPMLTATTFGGAALCPTNPEAACSEPALLYRMWPALQLAVLIAASAQGLRYWVAVEIPTSTTAS